MHTHTGCEHPDLQSPAKSGVKQQNSALEPHPIMAFSQLWRGRKGAALCSHRHDRSDPVHGNNLSVHMPENFILVCLLTDNAYLQCIYFHLQPQASSDTEQGSAEDAQVTKMCVTHCYMIFCYPHLGKQEGCGCGFDFLLPPEMCPDGRAGDGCLRNQQNLSCLARAESLVLPEQGRSKAGTNALTEK